MEEIHNEILKNPYVKNIKSEKGTMSGSVRFKYSAIVEYDFEVPFLFHTINPLDQLIE